MKSLIRLLSLLGVMLVTAHSLYAGNTGKIVGKVTDKESGEPVVGANVVVVGTTRGSVTDVEGKFTIIGIPIGTYTVRASQVGYASVDYKEVKVGADETTPLNFVLTSSAVQLTGVTTSADQQLVNSMSTSGTQTVSSKSIESIPNVKSVEDVLKLQAGVVKQGNNLFLRGGRANEVQYLVDGIPTNNILGNSGDLLPGGSANAQLAQLYAGVQSGVLGGGASGLAVSANAIQSVSVQASGFDADYGNAQSGIINIVTKSGGADRYSGSAQFRTDRLAATNQNEAYSAFSIGGPEPITHYLLTGLGAKIPGTITLFASADMDRSDGAYTFVHNEFYNPVQRRIELNGFLGGLMNGLGFRYLDNQNNNFTFNSKLKYDISGDDHVSYGYRASLSSTHDYSPYWRYRADSSTLGAGISIQHNLSWQHFFGTNSFIQMYLAKLETHDGNDVAGITPPDYSSAYQNTDVTGDGYGDLGTDQRWYKALTNVWSFRFDLNSQVHPLHLLKTGFEFNYEEINSTEIVYPTVAHTDSNGNPLNPPDPNPIYSRGEYPGYGLFRWNLNNYPNHGGAYVQDNIEFSGLNLHVGIRYDYFDIGKQVFYDDFIKNWERATLLTPEWAERSQGANGEPGDFVRLKNGSSFLWYATHGFFSPRFSIGYPVTDKIVFYFNYGHFYQFPSRDQYFRDPTIPQTNNIIGNPDLKPQKSISYEAGFEDQFTEDMAFALHAFYKDIFDYADLVTRGDYYIYRNLDYASARGFEFTLNQALTGNFSAALSYSYQIAKGRASDPLSTVYTPEFQLPRETRLNWDQEHTANLFVTYRVGEKEEGHFFGMPFVNNYGVSLTWSFGSGFPYTPYYGSRFTARNVYLINEATKPYTSQINLSIYKGFQIMPGVNLLATFDIVNLFNRRNVNNIYNFTGDVPKYGDYDPSTGVVYPWFHAESGYSGWSGLDPTNFQPPRQILLGVRLNWE